MTGGTYFSGGEGVGVAMRAMGIEHIFGVEYDTQISMCAEANGFKSIRADVREVDPAALPYVDLFHASTVCKNASNAKSDGEESPEDIETAEAVCRYIAHHKPRIFTLENVWGYRTFQSFQNILRALRENGYAVNYWHLNSADYGVPQTRKRLILIARRDGVMPRKPLATHTEKPRPMFEERRKWIGWYEAIEDLIPTLPPSKFADWQLERLPNQLTDAFTVSSTEQRIDTIRQADEPWRTVKAAEERMPRALLMQVQGEGGDGLRRPDEPMQSVTTAHGADKYRAFVVDGKLGSYGENLTCRDGDERFIAVTTSHNQRDLRAFLVNESSTMEVRTCDAPSASQVASERNGNQRAFLMPNENTSSGVVRDAAEPANTIGATKRVGNMSRAWLDSGRVVKMTPRALARFQSFPDSYILPEKTQLACTIIGNAVPPKLYEAVIQSLGVVE